MTPLEPVALAGMDSFADLGGSAFVDGNQREHQIREQKWVVHRHKTEVVYEKIVEEGTL
jgi:hypothetical protein